MRTYIGVYFGAAYLALVVTPLVIWLARRIGAVDRPGPSGIRRPPIPRIGGVAIYFSTLCIISASLLSLNRTDGSWFREAQRQVMVLLGTTTAVFLVGLVDDLRGLPARGKFTVELLGAAVLCAAGVRIDSIGIGAGPAISLGWLAFPITLFWIVGVTNAVNVSDGLDGLAAGLAAIACGVIAVLAIHGSTIHTGLAREHDTLMAVFALALLGSLSGFLFFNFNPAKVCLGDSGSLFIGFTIAATSVMCTSTSTALVGLALPALALGIPIFDTLFSMLRRFLERRSLFAPDRSHFHHRLLELGLNQRRAVLVIYTATLVAVGIGLCMLAGNALCSLALLGGAVFWIVWLFRAVGVVRLDQVLYRLQTKYRSSREERRERGTFEQLQLQFRRVRNRHQWRVALCEAGQRMDFARMSLRTTHEDGRVEEDLWGPSDGASDRRPLVTMTLPLRSGHPARPSQELEIAICVNGSLEAAARRATFLGRLLDENCPRATAPLSPGGPEHGPQGPGRCVDVE